MAYDTVGTNVTPDGFNKPNLVEARWTASTTEFVNATPNSGNLRIEFNSVGFLGAQGGASLGVMLQNLLHRYPEGGCIPGPVGPDGLELYFSVIDNLNVTPKLVAGVKLLANPDASPRFRRIFQDIDGLAIVGNNIYANDAIGISSISKPVVVEWRIARGNLVVNPTDATPLKRDIACQPVALVGDFREWQIEVLIDGVAHAVATYYLPEAYAQYLNPYAPIVLHQEHFGACDNKLAMNRSEVEYFDFRVKAAGEAGWTPIPNWRMNYSYHGECGSVIPSDIRHGMGTSVRNGIKTLISRAGHVNDDRMARCSGSWQANLLSCTGSGSPRVSFFGVDLPSSSGDVTITGAMVIPDGTSLDVRWSVSRLSDGTVFLGTDRDTPSRVVRIATPATSFSTRIDGLVAGTKYYFRLESIDSGGHKVTHDGSVFLSGLTFHANVRTLVSSFYTTILGRTADQAGLDYWAGEATRVAGLGADVKEVFYAMAMQFFASGEYVGRSTSDTQYLTDLYQTFFKRAPSAAELAYWQGELTAAQSRSALLNSFLFAQEFSNAMTVLFGASNVRPEVNMTMDLYRGTYGRLPDSAGFSGWLGVIRQAQCQAATQVSTTLNTVLGAFFNSPEYGNRARSDRDFMGDVYNAYMRRGPGGDTGGFNFWVGQVPSMGRDGVRSQFVPSAEFQARVSAIVSAGCAQ
jgi:hypothetical protein